MQRTVQLPKDIKTLRFERKGLDSDNPNAAVFVWYQLGSYYDLEQNAMLKIGSSMLEEKIYDTLRTKEQLGYLVFSGQRSQYVSSGFRIAVQSSEYNASHLLSRIDNLVNHVIPEHLDSITDDVWQGMLQSTIAAASERPTTLGKRTRTIWRAVEDSSYSFTRNKNTIEILKTLTKSTVINFLKSIFSSYTRVAILITSSHLQEPLYVESKDTWVVKDVAALRNALPLLALPINNHWQVESQQPELPPGLEAFENGEEEAEDDDDDEEEEEEEEDGEEEEEHEEHEEHDEEEAESDEEDPEE
jgi:insulysin